MSEHNGTVRDHGDAVGLLLPDKDRGRWYTPYSAVLVLLAYCSPAELQELKRDVIRRAQQRFPVQLHDASECPG